MKNETIQNINKIGRISNIVLKICKIIMIIGTVIMLITTGLMFTVSTEDEINVDFKGSGSIEIYSEILPLENMNFEFDDEAKSFLKTELVKNDANTSIYSISATIDNEKIAEIFTETRLKNILRLIAMIYIIVVLTFGEKIAKALSKCESPFEEAVIKALKTFSYVFIPMAFIDLDTGFDAISLTGILTVLIIFALVKVFEYGGKLQQESDETL